MSGADNPLPRADVVWTRIPVVVERVRRPSLTVERMVDAAVRVADAEGVDAVSMRRLATELETGTTSLYRQLSGKEDLLELMVDSVYGECALPEQPSGDWRTDLSLVATEGRQLMLRHSWLVSVVGSRPPIGPNALRYMDFALAAARGATEDATEASGLVDAVSSMVLGGVVNEVAEREAQRRSGQDERQWRETVQPYIQQVVESGRYPEVTRRVLDAVDRTHEQQFELGLELLLNGIAARIGAGQQA
ncbi:MULTISPECIES: TetR/AcrR family transcriptional regulator [unclassified Crossiella]|uniref:TetR/AcrR family transcriptional regulator n=1 Tax=Crossiella sp. CA-258035 TaxID=2981138 RepID=UPI0024BD4181|nr:TetR/AcrR family transcriptional regulator [Crossiella sp. CA-258035]WHT18227.1 TetR/AcrR family transcriptional regulator [Crossiella sp. CA-258035]